MNSASTNRGSDALAWFKSSFSTEQGGNCLEVAYAWRKSSYSGSEGGECLEVATCPTAVHVRDSKNPEGPALALSPAAWSAFTEFAVTRR
ncbi:toxin [Streptomyces nanshensis]|nr:toxin [Streptomyces nanshensis]